VAIKHNGLMKESEVKEVRVVIRKFW